MGFLLLEIIIIKKIDELSINEHYNKIKILFKIIIDCIFICEYFETHLKIQ